VIPGALELLDPIGWVSEVMRRMRAEIYLRSEGRWNE